MELLPASRPLIAWKIVGRMAVAAIQCQKEKTMQRLAQLVGSTVLSIFLLVPPHVSAATDGAAENIQAKKVVEDYFNALNESKLDAVVKQYHKDSVFLPKNAPAVRGIDEIAKAYRKLFESAKLDTEHVYHHIAVYGDVAIVESQGHGTLTLLESKKVVPSNNKELFVLRKIDGNWKIDRYMFNDSERPGA
jgi:uncharacterized protein (TIGR02246 family)